MRVLRHFLPLIWILLVGGSLLLAFTFKEYLPWIVGGGIGLIALLWILGCTFTSAVADRTCPKCGDKEGLIRPDKEKMLGVECTKCGYKDEDLYRAYLDEV